MKKNESLHIVTSVATIASGIAAVVGIFLVFYQIQQNTEFERTKFIFEVTKEMHTPEFINVYGELLADSNSIRKGSAPRDLIKFWKNFNNVSNNFLILAKLYNSKKIDKELAFSFYFRELEGFRSLLSGLSHIHETRKLSEEIEIAYNDMEKRFKSRIEAQQGSAANSNSVTTPLE